MSIRKRILPRSGKAVWQVDYKDSGGKRRHRRFATKRAADTYLIQARGEVVAGTHTADSASIMVREAADLWLARCERDQLEETTLRSYREHTRLHIVPRIGAVKL